MFVSKGTFRGVEGEKKSVILAVLGCPGRTTVSTSIPMIVSVWAPMNSSMLPFGPMMKFPASKEDEDGSHDNKDPTLFLLSTPSEKKMLFPTFSKNVDPAPALFTNKGV